MDGVNVPTSNSQSSSFQRPPRGRPSSWEDKLRGAIVTERLDDAIALLRGIRSTRLPSGRDLVYVITETSRRAGNADTVVMPLLAAVPLDVFDCTSEDDIMPMLSASIKTNNGVASSYRIILFLASKGVRFTAKAYSVLVKGFGVQRNEQMVDRVLLESGAAGVTGDAILFNTAIDAYIRCDHQKKAISLFDLVVSDKVGDEPLVTLPPSSVAASGSGSAAGAVAQLAGKSKKQQLAAQDPAVREALRKKLRGTELSAADAAASATSSAAAVASGAAGTDPATGPVSRVTTRGNEYLRALAAVFARGGVRPNVRSYNTLLKALKGGKGSFERCMDVVVSMRRHGMEPDSVTVNTLVDIGVHCGNLRAAEDLLAKPMAAPGVEAYTALISGHAAQGNVDAAFAVLDTMRARGVMPNVFTLTSLMKTCVTCEDWRRAHDLLEMGDSYLGPAGTAGVNGTKSGISTANQLATLRGSFVIGLCGMAVTLEGADDKEQFLNEAQRELLRMELDGLKPDTATMNAFLQALCAVPDTMGRAAGRSRVADALLVLRAMRRERIDLDDYTYSILFAALGREGFVSEALQLFKTARRQMDAVAVNALLRAFVGGRDPLQAVRLYQELLQANGTAVADYGHFEPTKFTFTILFVAIAKSLAPPERRGTVENRAGAGAGVVAGAGRSWSPGTKLAAKNLVFQTKYLGALTSMEAANTTEMRSVVVDTVLLATSNATRVSPLTALGEVLKSILSAGRPRPVRGKASGTAEEKPLQPLVYDTVQGRFYEQSAPDAEEAAAVADGTVSALAAAPTADADEAGPSAAASEVVAVPAGVRVAAVRTGTDDISAADSFARDPPAPAPTPTPMPEPTTAPIPSLPASAWAGVDLTSLSVDDLLQKLYRTMRYDREIEPDEVMVGALTTLFAIQAYGFDAAGIDGALVTTTDSTSASASASALAATAAASGVGGWVRRPVLSKRSADLVFEDLAISGWHPTQLKPILRCCSYTREQMQELLREGDDNVALRKLRASSASVRIFNKRGWNKMESGWTGFF